MDLGTENTIETKKQSGKVKYLKFCLACGEYYTTGRIDKLTCCVACKQRLTYRLNRGLAPVIDRSMRNKPNADILKKFGFKNTQQ